MDIFDRATRRFFVLQAMKRTSHNRIQKIFKIEVSLDATKTRCIFSYIFIYIKSDRRKVYYDVFM